MKRAELLEEMGIGNAVMHRVNKHRPLSPERLARNPEISKKRMPAKGVFGYLKRTLGDAHETAPGPPEMVGTGAPTTYPHPAPASPKVGQTSPSQE